MLARTTRLRSSWRAIPECMGKRTALFAAMIGLALAVSVCADDNVRAVQERLRDGGFYLGEIDGAYSSQLAAALTRYQVRKGLAVTGQLDVDTSNALGAKPAVTTGTAAPEQSSETWRRLRKRERRISTKAQETSSPRAEETESSTETQPRSAPAATARTSSEITESASGPPATGSEGTRPVSTPPATGRTSLETAKPASAPAVRPAPVSDTGS